MALSWAARVEQVVFSVAEMLGLEAAAPLALWPAGVLLLSVSLGLVLTLLLLGLHRPGDSAPELGKTEKAEEPKKRNRKKAGEKKLQRNGLTVEPQEEMKQTDVQSPSELKVDKAKKNKKKQKAPLKEAKSTPSERKEPEEAGAWETKVSNREKRQQRRKDKGAGDESGSPGRVGTTASVPNTEQTMGTPEEPKVTIPQNPTNTKKTTTTTKNTTRATSNNTPASAGQRKEEPPKAEVTHAVIPPDNSRLLHPFSAILQPSMVIDMSPGWEEVLSVNSSGWRELSVSAQVQPDTWHSHHTHLNTHTWPHDMEGSWTIVDAPFPGLPGTVEPPGISDLSMALQPPVTNEWSAQSSTCVDPASDWSAPCEEWGNYEDQPAEGTVSAHASPAELQESDTEKDKDEPAAPGSSKAKKKKKKKKKLEEGGATTQAEVEVDVTKDQNTAGIILPKTVKEQESVALSVPPRDTQKPNEHETTSRSIAMPAQKKPEESWESPKQVKKKKARRET